MPWVKINKYWLSIIIVLLFCITRVPRLHNDVVNPDAVNWHYRSQQFINGLKYKQFEKTYQHYHPGVTLMWIAGIPIEITKQITKEIVYTQANFPLFHLVVKSSVIFVQALLTIFIIYLLSKLLSFKNALLITGLFTLEPFFVGNSRLFHMDILLSLFVFISLLCFWISLKEQDLKYAILTGVFLGLSFLTKSVAILAFAYILAVSTYKDLFQKNIKRTLIVILSFLFFLFLFFPALWVKPIHYLGEIFSEAERVGIRKGHKQIVLGESTKNGGVLFYPLVLIMKASPLLIVGSLLFVFAGLSRKAKTKSFTLTTFLSLFYWGYFFIMFVPSKKLDRYLLVMFPYLAYLSYFGLKYLVKKMKSPLVPILLVVTFILLPLATNFPYYFTYVSPLFMGADNANKVIGQKPFGVGVFDLRDRILNKYGSDIRIGFYDTKPMKSIYSNSKVVDVRVVGPSHYDLLVLAVNEQFPEKIRNSNHLFKKDFSLYINGLEYWRVYVKENK